MADTSATCAWDHGECTGTVHCPPRCPRFVDATGTPLLVRPLTDERRPALIAMYREYDPADRSMGLPPAGEAEIERWLDRLRERGTNLLAVADERVLGHAGFVPTDGDPEFLVYVHGDAHGRGIGTELTRQAVAYAADAGHDGLLLNVHADNEPAVAVYRKLGFETVDREGGELTMRLSFAAPVASEVRLPPAERATGVA